MKKVWLTILLSVILPGLGHLYLGKFTKGWGLLFGYILSLILTSVLIGVFIMFAIWIYSIVNSYKVCSDINNSNPVTT